MEVIMRRARRSDADAINDIFNQAVTEGESDLDIDVKDTEYRRQWLAYHSRRHPVYVGELEGRVVCWVALSPYSGHYAYDGVAELEMYVAPQYRHQGLGGLLLKFIEQQAMNLGYYKIVLSVYAANLQALHAYRRAGYRDVGVFRNHGYRKGKLYDMVFMERLLPVDMEALNRYYRETYPFYEEYFHREEALYEAQMLRNGMVRSEENPDQWIPGSARADYVDDWNGQTVRVVKNAPALEKIMAEEEKAREAAEAARTPESAPAPQDPQPSGDKVPSPAAEAEEAENGLSSTGDSKPPGGEPQPSGDKVPSPAAEAEKAGNGLSSTGESKPTGGEPQSGGDKVPSPAAEAEEAGNSLAPTGEPKPADGEPQPAGEKAAPAAKPEKSGEGSQNREQGARRAGAGPKEARRTASGNKRRERSKKKPQPEDDGPLEGQILLDEVIGRQG